MSFYLGDFLFHQDSTIFLVRSLPVLSIDCFLLASVLRTLLDFLSLPHYQSLPREDPGFAWQKLLPQVAAL